MSFCVAIKLHLALEVSLSKRHKALEIVSQNSIGAQLSGGRTMNRRLKSDPTFLCTFMEGLVIRLWKMGLLQSFMLVPGSFTGP